MSAELLAAAAGGGGVQRVLDLARRHLDMDLAYLAELDAGQQVYRGLSGDAASFGAAVGGARPARGTYCELMVEGRLPSAVGDTRAHPLTGGLAVTREADVGAYVGVPVTLTDGTTYGSRCVVHHSSRPVDERDARFLALLADLVAADVEADRERAGVRDVIRDLLHRSALDIALQPVVDLLSGRLLGVEALARFPPPYGRPDEVFADAHASDLGHDLEVLAARAALRLLPLLGDEHYLAVNLTPGVAVEVVSGGSTAGLPLDRLVLEITEHAAVDSYAVLRDALAAARADGLRLAIDDAGAGYASLHHVVELGPDVIKVDRSLVHGVADDAGRRSVVAAFLTLARGLGAVVVAEGVERAADLLCLHDLGVDAAQGYLLARPTIDRDRLEAWRSGPLHDVSALRDAAR